MVIIFFSKDGTTSVSKNIVKLEPLCIAGGNVKWCNCCGKQFGDSSKSYGEGDLPDPGAEPTSSALQLDSLPSEPPSKSWKVIIGCVVFMT